MSREPAEIERELEAARRTLAADLDALTAKAAPRRLKAVAVARARVAARASGAKLARRARSRPLSAAAIALAIAGGAWLLFARRAAGRRRWRPRR